MNKKWDLDVVGVLATDEEIYIVEGKQAIFINREFALQFKVKLISEKPESFPNVRYFTGYVSDIEDYGFEDDLTKTSAERIEKLREFLNDYLIIFKPYNRGDHFHITNVRLKVKPSAYNLKSNYIAVPVFSSGYHKKTYDEFLSQLLNNKFVGQIKSISSEVDDTPPIIIWQREDKSYVVIGEIDKHLYAHGGFRFEFDELKAMDVKEAWLNDIFEVEDNETLIFIGIDTHLHMLESLKEAKKVEKHDLKINETLNKVKEETSISNKDCDSDNSTQILSEQKFLIDFIRLTNEQGLIYDEEDLINFHTAMKSSKLVILSGMSGTGKSKLVQAYGKALGMDDNQLNIIPVRPSWSDDADLIGYMDSIHNVYRPGDSGLINTLIQASKPENMFKMFIICFDEMNLARVEHYFSQFLSVLEMDSSHRKLRLYNDELETRLYNSAQYSPTINIGENILFVGTVNIDESTYHFSDKVLDRANVITLRPRPFEELKKIKYEKKQKQEEMTLDKFKEFKDLSVEIKLLDEEISLLQMLNDELHNVSKNMGIGFRIVKQIDMYLKNLPAESKLNRRKALDLQIIQRVMTKIRGPQEQLQAFIGRVNLESNDIKDSKLMDILNKFNDISDFTETKKIVLHKAKELKMYGYTI